MKHSYQGLALLAAALACPLAAPAERIERSFRVNTDTVVEVRNQIGQVKVRGWSQPQVRVIAVSKTRAVEPHLEQTASRVHLHTHVLESAASASDRVVDYEIWAPPDAHLDVYLGAGTLQVENFTEDVRVEAPTATVRLYRLDGNTVVKTLGGSVEVDSCTGRLEINSVSGTLRFRNTDTYYLVAETTSGDIFYEGDVRRGGSYEFRNHAGLVELALPAAASFELNANSVQGEVTNEFPLTPRSHGRVPQRAGIHSLLGTVQSGEAMIRVTSFSGTIRVRKR